MYLLVHENDKNYKRFQINFSLAIKIKRCADIGKFAMTGSGVRQCIHSEWNGQRPTCLGLNQENDYASIYFYYQYIKSIFMHSQ